MPAPPLVLPAPIGPQPEWLDSPASRKVIRAGRRTGKTRFALLASVAGHGPGPDGHKLHPGILQGGDVVWVAQDYPNLTTVMWREEIVPRFGHLPHFTTNAAEHFVSCRGAGTLYLRSAEAIGGIRGIGNRLRGVVVDEAAWLDLESGLQDVILPALMDNEGWLVLMSTTNAGPDGNSAKRVPSYFNLICEQIRDGSRGGDWQAWHATAHDNPVISDRALNDLIAEYPPDSPSLRQEVYAELLRGGVGMALPDLDEEAHMVPAFKVPRHWEQFGAFDWGYHHPYVFGHFAADEDGTVYLVDCVTGRKELPRQIADRINAEVPVRSLRYIVAGHDVDQKHRARGETGPTIREQFHEQGISLTLANIARVDGLNNFRRYVDWKGTNPDGSDGIPRFRVMDTPNNRKAFRCLQQMQVDPKNPEDALKVDADHNGEGGDDFYDMCRYALMSRPYKAKAEERDVDAFDPAVLAVEVEQTLKLGNRLKRRKRHTQHLSDGY